MILSRRSTPEHWTSLKHRSVLCVLLHMAHWEACGLGDDVATCSTATDGVVLGRFSSIDETAACTGSLKTRDLSRRWISFSKKVKRNFRSLSWPSPSRDHSNLKSWGSLDSKRGVKITPYWVPSMPRAAKDRVWDCKSSFSLRRAATEHLLGTDMFNNVCTCVKIMHSLRPNLSLNSLLAIR